MVDVIYEVATPIDDTFCDSVSNSVTGVDPLTFGRYNTVVSRVFVRFASMIPKNARIVSAYLRVTSYATLSWTSFLPVVRLVDLDSCPDFSSNPFNLPTSVSGVQFDAKYWVRNAVYDIDVSILLQEFVNRLGYLVGNYIGFRIDEGNSVLNERQAGWQRGTMSYYTRLVVSFIPTHFINFEATPIQVEVLVDSISVGVTPVVVEVEEKSHQVQVSSTQQA